MFVHDSTLDKYVKLIKNGNRVKVTGIVRDTEWNLEINVNQIELIP